MSDTTVVRPALQTLAPEQIEHIHRYSLEILSTVGIWVDLEKARKIFQKAEGATVEEDGRVLFQPELVDWAIQAAPSSIDIYDRLGKSCLPAGR